MRKTVGSNGTTILFRSGHRKNRFEILSDHKLLLMQMYRRPHELIMICSAALKRIDSHWKIPVHFSDDLHQNGWQDSDGISVLNRTRVVVPRLGTQSVIDNRYNPLSGHLHLTLEGRASSGQRCFIFVSPITSLEKPATSRRRMSTANREFLSGSCLACPFTEQHDSWA